MNFLTKTSSGKLNTLRRMAETSHNKAAKHSNLLLIICTIVLLLLMVSLYANAGTREIPAMPGQVSGQKNVCAYVGAGVAVTYSIEPVPGAAVYLWTVPSTVNIISGQGTTSIIVTFAMEFTASAN